MTIPKIIWQTWKSRVVHPIAKAQIDHTRALNPNYTYHLFDDADVERFMVTECSTEWPEVLACYRRLNRMVAKVDLWRYLVLYKYGGVYLDMDSAMVRPLDEMIGSNDNAIISMEGGPDRFVQWALVFAPGHPILRRLIEIIIDNVTHDRYHNDILMMTGPGAFTIAVNQHHSEIYGKDLGDITHQPNPNTNNVYGIGEHTYRIFGVDYNGQFTYKFPNHHLIYGYGVNDVVYWRNQPGDLLVTREAEGRA